MVSAKCTHSSDAVVTHVSASSLGPIRFYRIFGMKSSNYRKHIQNHQSMKNSLRKHIYLQIRSRHCICFPAPLGHLVLVPYVYRTGIGSLTHSPPPPPHTHTHTPPPPPHTHTPPPPPPPPHPLFRPQAII